MAASAMMFRIAKSGTRSSSFLHATRGCFTSHSTTINTKTLQTPLFQARSFAYSTSILDPGNQKKYYIFGGRGTGKTNCAASLAVTFADHGHQTMLISFDPTRSLTLSESFDQIYPEAYTKDFGDSFKDHMNTQGLGKLVEKYGESSVAQYFYSPQPAFDEAFLITGLMHIAESPEYSMYTRVVFDTSCKGDDLLHQFLSESGIRDEAAAISPMIEAHMMRETNERRIRARELISGSTEHVIVTNPTVMGILESSRIHASIKKKVLVRRLIVNKFLPPSSTYSSKKRENEMRSIKMIKKDQELGNLDILEVPLVGGEMIIRGIQGLKSMGDLVWK